MANTQSRDLVEAKKETNPRLGSIVLGLGARANASSLSRFVARRARFGGVKRSGHIHIAGSYSLIEGQRRYDKCVSS